MSFNLKKKKKKKKKMQWEMIFHYKKMYDQ